MITKPESIYTMIVCLLVMLVIVGSMLLRKKKTQQDKAFILLLCSHILLLFSEIVLGALEGKPGVGNILMVLATFTYVLCISIYYCFARYIFSLIGEKAVHSKGLLKTLGLFCILPLGATFVSIWTGSVFYIDEQNIHHYGPYYNILYLAMIIGAMLLILGVILYHRKDFRRKDFWILIIYPLLPTLAGSLHIFQSFTALQYLVFTLTLLFIYINVQARQEEILIQRELELADSHMAVMLSQIQPHFLYNTLNAIDQLCFVDPERAHRAILTFSKYLRENMDSLSKKSLVTFEEELEHTKLYLELEKMRFEENLKIVVDTPFTDFMVPVLTLQPVVENAVRYGASKRPGGGTVTISTAQDETCWRIIVADDGAGFDPADSLSDDGSISNGRSHMGIANVRSRLTAACGGKLHIDSRQGKGTIVTIEIPREVKRI
ncbi:MAG: histidine kinase [Bacillota bacterium]|nr:histidine kinase [Bacillota bacterium]